MGSHISVKSTKHFGQLLLLEVDDWSDTGKYIPNKDKEIEKILEEARLAQ